MDVKTQFECKHQFEPRYHHSIKIDNVSLAELADQFYAESIVKILAGLQEKIYVCDICSLCGKRVPQ